MHRLHGIHQHRGIVIATYLDEPMAHIPRTAAQAQADFLLGCDRNIARLERELADLKLARAKAQELTEADFVEVSTTYGRNQ